MESEIYKHCYVGTETKDTQQTKTVFSFEEVHFWGVWFCMNLNITYYLCVKYSQSH
jgi:hypothetical protein